MTYGVPPTKPLNTPVENDNNREQGPATSTVAADANPAAQEEKERVIEGSDGPLLKGRVHQISSVFAHTQ